MKNKMKNIAKKILTSFMIVAVAVVVIGTKPGHTCYGKPKGEDKLGYSIVITKPPIGNTNP